MNKRKNLNMIIVKTPDNGKYDLSRKICKLILKIDQFDSSFLLLQKTSFNDQIDII